MAEHSLLQISQLWLPIQKTTMLHQPQIEVEDCVEPELVHQEPLLVEAEECLWHRLVRVLLLGLVLVLFSAPLGLMSYQVLSEKEESL